MTRSVIATANTPSVSASRRSFGIDRDLSCTLAPHAGGNLNATSGRASRRLLGLHQIGKPPEQVIAVARAGRPHLGQLVVVAHYEIEDFLCSLFCGLAHNSLSEGCSYPLKR